MVTVHDCRGDKRTTFYTFQMYLDGMDVIITPGEYWNQEEMIFSTETETKLTIPKDGYYRVWIYPDGLRVIEGYEAPDGYINVLVWAEVPENTTSLNDADVHFIRMVGEE